MKLKLGPWEMIIKVKKTEPRKPISIQSKTDSLGRKKIATSGRRAL